MNYQWTIAIITTIMLVTVEPQALAAQVAGVKFNESYRDQSVVMQLRGTGLKTMVFFKAFAAGYYSNASACDHDRSDVSKRIEVEYFVNIPSKKLNAYTIDRMKDNVSSKEFASIAREIAMMEKLFVDLKSGDRFSLTYIPGVGTQFAHNGQLTGVIKGDDFAKALFAVWVGDRPFDMQLKNQMCGLNKVML